MREFGSTDLIKTVLLSFCANIETKVSVFNNIFSEYFQVWELVIICVSNVGVWIWYDTIKSFQLAHVSTQGQAMYFCFQRCGHYQCKLSRDMAFSWYPQQFIPILLLVRFGESSFLNVGHLIDGWHVTYKLAVLNLISIFIMFFLLCSLFTECPIT